MSIFNSDDFRRGYKEGYLDGLKDKDRDTIHMGSSWKFVIWGSPALDTYTQGYNTGYLDGTRARYLKTLMKTDGSLEAEPEQASEIEQDTDPGSLSVLSNEEPVTRISSTTKNSNSMATQSLEQQLAATQQMLKFLEQYANSLNQIASQYNDKIHTMRETGVPIEVCNWYEVKFLVPEVTDLKKIEYQVRHYDIPYVKDVIISLQEAINRAKR